MVPFHFFFLVIRILHIRKLGNRQHIPLPSLSNRRRKGCGITAKIWIKRDSNLTSLLEPEIRTEVRCCDSESISLPGNDTRSSNGTPTTQVTNSSPIPVDSIPVCTPLGPGNGMPSWVVSWTYLVLKAQFP